MAAPISISRPRSLWRNRDFLLLWGGQAVSTIGSQASLLALPLLMLALTGSPAQAGLLGGLRGAAYVLLGLPAGALVDRWNRRPVMLVCDLVRALAFASLPLALFTHHLSPLQLYVVTFIEGAAYAFFGLAETASLTRVVPPEQLPVAVSRNDATEAISVLIGPPLGGALFGIGRALPFLADAVSYGLSVISILLIRARLQGERSEQRALLAEMREGLRWIWRRPVVHLLAWLAAGMNVVYGGWTLLLIELAHRLGAGPAAIGVIFACGGAGTVLGAVLTPRMQRLFTVGQLVIGAAWLFALTWPPYAQAPNRLILGAVNAIGFVFVPVTFGTQFSYRLLLLPDALQARVNSVFFLVAFGGQSLGFLLSGPIATVWITFIPAVAIALLATLSAQLRRVGLLAEVKPDPTES